MTSGFEAVQAQPDPGRGAHLGKRYDPPREDPDLFRVIVKPGRQDPWRPPGTTEGDQ